MTNQDIIQLLKSKRDEIIKQNIAEDRSNDERVWALDTVIKIYANDKA